MCLDLDRPDPSSRLETLGADIRTVLHGEQSFDYLRLAYAGDRLTFRTRVSDAYSKKGGALEFVVRTTEVTRDGEPIATISDRRSRKQVIVVCMAAWSFMTVAFGMAQNFWQMFLARMGVGIGEAGFAPAAFSMIADYFPKDKRTTASAIAAMGAMIGTTAGLALGGFIVDQLTWHWVFFVNIPFGIASATILIIYLRENVTRLQPQIDYAGAMILVIAIGALMMMLVQGGTAWAWLSTPTLILAVTSGVSFGLFILQEKRAPEPLLPLDLMVDPTIMLANVGGMLGGGLIFALSSFIPTFAQGVLGASAMEAARSN